jgi:acyl-CoA thioester hydrolase
MGVTQLSRWGIGPVILHERYSFFKEIYADQTVIVSVEIDGCSDDSSIYRFVHKFYTPDGVHCATAEATGVWIDMMLRKMTTPPDDVVEAMNKYKARKQWYYLKKISKSFLSTRTILIRQNLIYK